MDIGNKIKLLRQKIGATQEQLGEKIGVSAQSISKWEKGDSLPDIEVLYNICNLYGVTLDYLTHEGNYSEKKEYIIKKNQEQVNDII